MHRSYYCILWFVLILLGPATLGEIYVRSLPNPAKSKHDYLSKHSNEVETLVLGSSHTYYGINPLLLGKHAFSAAMSSQTLRYDDYILHAYSFPRLKTIILPVSDFSFYEDLEGSNSWYIANRYRLYMSCDIHPRFSVYDWEITSFRTYIEKLKTLWQPARMKWGTTGQGLEYTIENRDSDWDNGEERARVNRYTDLSGAKDIVPYLEHIAQTAENRHIGLLLLSTPLRPGYRMHQNPVQLADMHRIIRKMEQKYSCIRYLDLMSDSRFDSNDFYDSDHLNANGADKMTRIISDYLKQ